MSCARELDGREGRGWGLSYKEDGGTRRILLGVKKAAFVPLGAHSQKVPHQKLFLYLPLRLLRPKMSVSL